MQSLRTCNAPVICALTWRTTPSRSKKLGLPKDSKESFTILGREGVIPVEMANGLEAMVGFRNILVHQYKDIDLDLMVEVIEDHLDDLVAFTNMIVAAFGAEMN